MILPKAVGKNVSEPSRFAPLGEAKRDASLTLPDSQIAMLTAGEPSRFAPLGGQSETLRLPLPDRQIAMLTAGHYWKIANLLVC